MRPALTLFAFWLPFLAAACGGRVVVDATSAGAGAGGAPGTTVTTSSTSSTSSSSVTTAGAGGGGPKTCGGDLGAPCPPGEFCDYGDDHCGGNDAPGVCQPLPGDCPPDCPGVCGCDGQFHCSACAAHGAGTDVDASGGCASPGLVYSAVLFPLDADHMILRAADPARDVCLQIFLDSPSVNAPAFAFTAPATWGVDGAWISAKASDCEAGFPNSPTDPQPASNGAGSISWDVQPGMGYPCEVSFQAKLQFPGAPAWVHPVEVADAKGVKLEKGCF